MSFIPIWEFLLLSLLLAVTIYVITQMDQSLKPPVSKSPWEGILMANKDPPLCLQKELFDILVDDKFAVESSGQEDCLYLNVHTPKPSNTDANLPVMVFIHGGGFICGGASLYGPKALVNDEIVLVVIQYRLGVFGFFSTADPVLPGNMGLKDQQLALKWVKENIKYFGGNPDSITLFGESAGAASVHYQMLSPGSKDLFHRVIMQSGNLLPRWASSKYNKKLAIDAGNALGCPFKEKREVFLKCMQEIDAHKLLDLSFNTTIIGFTKNPSLMTKLHDDFEKYGPFSLYLNGYSDSAEMAERVYKYYLKEKFNSISEDDENLLELYNDLFFGFGFDTLITILAEDPDVSLYLYRVDHVGEFTLTDLVPGFQRKNWVSHADELFYQFYGSDFLKADLKGDDLKFRSIINSLWRNYAKTGPRSIIKWDKVEGADDLKQLILTTSPKMAPYDFKEKRKFWRSLRTQENILMEIYENPEDIAAKTEL
ncbi:Carboxylesterase 1C [Armadillidium nasatum]|uniref:Carboxylic ester hydrolase n=1 Tax=Armadillidium nasatum TaxID=96803 RepID=A0A5N5T135_9CRUS|nr:Carboxylesterase 1C [Armadillidium nasatum]